MDTWQDLTAAERETCLRVLQAVADNPSVIADDDRMKALIAKIQKAGRKGERQAQSALQRENDRALRTTTAMVRRDLDANPLALEPSQPGDAATSTTSLRRPVNCYICKSPYTTLHSLYHRLCPTCAETNHARRHQQVDLSGQTAILTGGRIKIGYQTALRLLRDGARVIVTTRFPCDARERFAAEDDFLDWTDRLQVHGLDLRNLSAVEAFTRHLLATEPHADILINNAAQTVKRPLGFFQHLLEREDETPVLLESLPGYPGPGGVPSLPLYGEVSGLPELCTYFPSGLLDPHGQQVDLRPENSWSLRLHEVPTLELLEVHLVNAVAPFVLCRELKPLLLRSPHSRRFIINVSAMEGQFTRESKTDRHPHTNMAKAALNMLTRTSAADFARDNIYMNSVDTGWITDENPQERQLKHREERGFFTPLDILDGTARIYDPIVRGLSEAEEPPYGHFLKDYAPYPW